MLINIDLGEKYSLEKMQQMKRSIFDVSYSSALKPLFFEKYKIKWIQTDRYTIGSFSRFESSPIKWKT